MKNARRILLATALFTSAVATGSASAQTTPTNGTFNNTALTFTLNNDVTNFTASVLSSYETKNSDNANAAVSSGFNITGFGLSEVTTTTNVAANFPTAGGTRHSGPNTFYTWNDKWQMAPLSLTAGTYNFTVQGAAGSSGGFNGSYSYTAAVSPVPEPATYAMLLAGIAVIGAAALRKAKQEKGGLALGSKFGSGPMAL